MNFLLVLLTILALALAGGIIIGLLYWTELRQIWRSLKADRISISIYAFISEYLKMKIRSKIPPDLIFEAFQDGKKAEVLIDILTLKNFYKIIDVKVPAEIHKFNSNLIESELRIKRLWSRFVIGGSFDEVCQTIIDTPKEYTSIAVKGKLQTKSEKEFEAIVNYIVTNALAKSKELSVLMTPVKQVVENKKGEVQEKLVQQVDSAKLIKHFSDELRSELKDARIYLSKGDSHAGLKRHIFRDTYRALYNSLQSGLAIQFRDIESYLNRNINIKVTLELLNRLYDFDQSVDLQKLDRFILLVGENENVLRSLIDAKKANIQVSLDELWDYHLRGGNMSNMLEVLIKAENEGLSIRIPDMTGQLSAGRDDVDLARGMIKLHKEGIAITLKELAEFQRALKSIDVFVQDLIRASHVGLYFSYSGLISFHHNDGDMLKLMNVMIQAHQANLDISIDDCMQLNHDKYDFNRLLEALKIKKRSNIDVTKEKLMNLQSAGGNMQEYMQALEAIKSSGLDIKPEVIEADLIEGRKVVEILFAIMHASKEGLKIDYNVCVKYERRGLKVPEIVKWAVEPSVISLEPLSIIAKDGIEIKLGINITIRGKFYMYFSGSRNEVLISRIKEGLIKEVERYASYQSVLESLNLIAYRLLLRLTAKMNSENFPELDSDEIEKTNGKEEKLNAGSAFEILDINVPIIDVDNDTLASIKREIAELEKEISKHHSEKRKSAALALELEAKAKLIEAKAELQRGIAEAFRNGHMNTKEYHKMKILEDSKPLSYDEKNFDDIE